MGKGFNSKITKKNVSKKVADVQRRQKAFEKTKKHIGRAERKKREFELRRLARKKQLESKVGGAAAARARLENLAKKRAR